MFISHRLEEVFGICQRVTIMRDGKFVLTAPTERTRRRTTIIRSMVGRDLGELYSKTGTVPGEVGADGRAADAARTSSTTSASRSAGARSSPWPAWWARAAPRWPGRSSGSTAGPLARCGCGGQALPNGSPAAAMAAGIAFVPEDRRQQGLVMDLGIDHNIALASLRRLSKAG